MSQGRKIGPKAGKPGSSLAQRPARRAAPDIAGWPARRRRSQPLPGSAGILPAKALEAPSKPSPSPGGVELDPGVRRDDDIPVPDNSTVPDHANAVIPANAGIQKPPVSISHISG
ncbi:MAG TPA: hypothetical protein ENK26_04330 [Gammaproteobacteria bacterium]|nr:hypothetical protein [Gammaproteobacteria bacterium]